MKENTALDNRKIFEAFVDYLFESGLSQKTVKKHIENIDFFYQ